MARREPDTFFLLFFFPSLIFLGLSGLTVVFGVHRPVRITESANATSTRPVISYTHMTKESQVRN